GGVTGADRSLQPGVKLPGEKDAPLFAIGTQPPESKQIDVLNIYNDGSLQDRTGTMTSTSISGLGLAKDLDFGPVFDTGNPQTFGEPAIFPGGISFGTVQFVDGKFTTNGAKSTIEVVNLLLGSGNDHVDVQGTLDPDVTVKLTGTLNVATTAGGIDLTRPQPFDWKSQGFLVGQTVHITGFSETFTVTGFGDDNLLDTVGNTIMHLSGTPTPAELAAAPPEITFTKTLPVTLSGSGTSGTVHRASGDWQADNCLVGQTITFSCFGGTWRITAMTNGNNYPQVSGTIPAGFTGTATRTISAVVRTVTADDVPVQSVGVP